jgi:uncharacterized membrane protein (UPF0136 family)
MIDFKNLEPKIISFNFVFGAIVVIGGLVGYFTAGSVPSLAAGMFFGNLLMLTIWGSGPSGTPESKPKTWGYYVAAVASACLLSFFIIRLLKTGKPMPAAIIIPLAILGILGNIFVLHQRSLKSGES